jgi:hypothetical protein
MRRFSVSSEVLARTVTASVAARQRGLADIVMKSRA